MNQTQFQKVPLKGQIGLLMAWLSSKQSNLKKRGKICSGIFKACFPTQDKEPSEVGINFDSYKVTTTKQLTQMRRGTPGKVDHISSRSQFMPNGSDWDCFLLNAENKSHLISSIVNCAKDVNVRRQFRVPITITELEKTWMITSTEVRLLKSNSHREADTRIILYAAKSRNPVIVRATDTDILVLLTLSWSIICKPDTEWLMNIDHKGYVSIKSICSRIGNAVCQILPAYRAITGCDTTSYPFGIEKIKPFKQMEKLRKYHLLSQLIGSSLGSVENLSNAKLFFRTCM